MSGERELLTLELVTLLEAPRPRVFRALTEAASVTQWWGPRGFTMPQVELDLRVGGKYRFTMQPPEGEVFHLSGQFLAIDVPSRLSYTFRYEEPDPDDRDTVVDVSLGDAGEHTELALSHGEFATEARLALHRGGWTDSLDRLRAFLRATPRRR